MFQIINKVESFRGLKKNQKLTSSGEGDIYLALKSTRNYFTTE